MRAARERPAVVSSNVRVAERVNRRRVEVVSGPSVVDVELSAMYSSSSRFAFASPRETSIDFVESVP